MSDAESVEVIARAIEGVLVSLTAKMMEALRHLPEHAWEDDGKSCIGDCPIVPDYLEHVEGVYVDYAAHQLAAWAWDPTLDGDQMIEVRVPLPAGSR